MSIDDLRAQYEAYPYPARDPKDEARRLVTGSPSHLDEVSHYVFGGRLTGRDRPLSVLVAGGGTGDGTIMIAQQMADAGIAGTVTYLDLSTASRAVAEARAAARGLTNLRFVTGSLLDAAGLGTFDYIDCCGVLHHLDDPAAGLRALVAALAPGGGMGIMVYAPYGREGVYPLQQALRTLGGDLPLAEQVALARRLVTHLPPTNGLRRNPFMSDHRGPDAALYDLLLHSCDRPYTVGELAELAAAGGMSMTALVEPMRYDPALWVTDARILKRLENLPWLERAAWAERVGGSLSKHIAYLTRPEDAAAAVAAPDGPGVVPVLRDLDGKAMARGLPPGAVMEADLAGITVSLPLPRLAGPILARIDGRADLATLHAQVQEAAGVVPWDTFKSQFDQLFKALNGIGKMYLRRPA
ncbi:SAM-dependent methyltransferase [Azospirillum fermentarium]|uniref:class I SAM-dependent methyltransferase n=1 Tax=Azospirillum fermentarium TaxID=1233114 RepID=UPI0022270314|nr:class I SAM-dependent methyltransferase [Azospirillum fermentarium]MCW2245185.1 SAM-dependent methyltransferase [Azospirillum fermentarium]